MKQFDKFIILIYVGLIAWLGFKLFKSKKSVKNLQGDVKVLGKDHQLWNIFCLDF